MYIRVHAYACVDVGHAFTAKQEAIIAG